MHRVHLVYSYNTLANPFSINHAYYNAGTWVYKDIFTEAGFRLTTEPPQGGSSWTDGDSHNIGISACYNSGSDEAVMYCRMYSSAAFTHILKFYLPSWNGTWQFQWPW